jgi:Protein of unknown function (DUF2934)
MKTNDRNDTSVNRDEIADLARQIWEREGRQNGRDLEYWLRAERQVQLRRNMPGNLPRKTSTADTAHSHGTNRAIMLPNSAPELSDVGGFMSRKA